MIILIMDLQIFTMLDVSTDDILSDTTWLFCGSGSGLPLLRFNFFSLADLDPLAAHRYTLEFEEGQKTV